MKLVPFISAQATRLAIQYLIIKTMKTLINTFKVISFCPIIAIATFYSFMLYVYFKSGYSSIYNYSDPKEVNPNWIYNITDFIFEICFYLSFIWPLIYIYLRVVKVHTNKLYLRVYIYSIILLILICSYDPKGLIVWFND